MVEIDPKSVGWTEALGGHVENPPTARSGDSITALGKTWKVSSCETRIKAQFEQWVRKNARSSIADAIQSNDLQEADSMRKAYQGDFGAGHYSWDGKYVISARSDMPGLRYLLYLLMVRCDDKVTEEIAIAVMKENPIECGLAIGWALGN